MTHHRNQSQDIDTTLWPQVDIHALSPEQRAIFTKRQRAIQMYAEGQTIRAIEDQAGINRRQLYSLLHRCLMVRVDGTVIGFPAMAGTVVRPIPSDLHPIVTGSYRIATPAVQAFYEFITRCLRYRTTGEVAPFVWTETGKA